MSARDRNTTARGRERTVRKTVTFTPEEWDTVRSMYLKAHAGYGCGGFNDFARRLLLQGGTVVCEDPATGLSARKTIRETHRIMLAVGVLAAAAAAQGAVDKDYVDQLMRIRDDLVNDIKGMYTNVHVPGRIHDKHPELDETFVLPWTLGTDRGRR